MMTRTHPSDNVVTRNHVTNWNLNISSSKRFMITKLCRVFTKDEGNSPLMSHDPLTTKSHEVTWQKKPKFFLLHNACDHQTFRMETYNAGKLTHNVTWPSDHIVTWRHVTNQKQNISSSARPMATKLGRVVTYDEGNSPIMTLCSRDHVKSREKLKT